MASRGRFLYSYKMRQPISSILPGSFAVSFIAVISGSLNSLNGSSGTEAVVESPPLM